MYEIITHHSQNFSRFITQCLYLGFWHKGLDLFEQKYYDNYDS
jgi:hypothetical protein